MPPASEDPFIHQELTELMYHTLWETVHVFFEQAEKGDDLGAASFLYPSLVTAKRLRRIPWPTSKRRSG